MLQNDEDPINLLENSKEIKPYKRRWIILLIFIYYAAVNSFQWIEYSIITNIVIEYYNVSAITVNWTSVIYMAIYSPLVIPASYIVDKKGLRFAGVIGCLGTTLGTAIKVLSIERDQFYVVLIGQGILAASQTLILCLPPKIAAVWFKANEVSTACSLGVLGTQLGCAIGFVVPPAVVKLHENIYETGNNFRVLCWGLTISIIPVAIAVLFYFPKQPPKPPSVTQAEERSNKCDHFSNSEFFQSVKKLFYNSGFNIHMVAYSINIAVFSAVCTLMNQFILHYFPGAEEDAGRMGLLMVITGLIGSVIFGIFLDKTHKYKETTIFTYFMCALSMCGFMYSLEFHSKVWAYITISISGIFSGSYMPIGFELAMELIYPSPEGTTSGVLIASSQILGVIFTLFLGKFNEMVGPFWSIGSQAAALALGTLITAFVPNKLRRQEAFNRDPKKNGVEFIALPLKETIAE